MTSNAELLARRQQAVPRGVASLHGAIFADRAENSTLWDVDGKSYIDFAGGIAVLNTGHRHPRVMAAVEAQMQRFTHTAFQVNPYECYVQLAERLNALAPGNSPKKTLLMSTGAEAVENAVKIARTATKRSAVIAFTGGFHGRTMLTMGLTGKVAPYKAGFGPLPGEIYHIPYPCELHNISEERTLADLHRVFKADVEADRVAAIIIEPVQGEGGFYVASPSFMQKLRQICDQHGILLICDEVQTGAGRTGRLFATEHGGIEADLITMAKSLAGGFPLSAIVGRADIMDSVPPGGLGGTYAGSPLGCAAALAVLDVMEEEKLLERSHHMGELLQSSMNKLADRFPRIKDVRGLGAMVAMEFIHDDHSPDTDTPKVLVSQAAEQGLILLSCGIYSNVIRILVPLTASDEELNKGMAIIENCLQDILG